MRAAVGLWWEPPAPGKGGLWMEARGGLPP